MTHTPTIASPSSCREGGDQERLPPMSQPRGRQQQQQPQSPPRLTILRRRPRCSLAITATAVTVTFAIMLMMSCCCGSSDSSFSAGGVRAQPQQHGSSSNDILNLRGPASIFTRKTARMVDDTTTNQKLVPSTYVEARQRELSSFKWFEDDGNNSRRKKDRSVILNVNRALGADKKKKKSSDEQDQDEDGKSNEKMIRSENDIRMEVNQKLREKALKKKKAPMQDNGNQQQQQQKQKDKKIKEQLQTTQQKNDKKEKDDAKKNKKKKDKEQSPKMAKNNGNDDDKKKKDKKDKKDGDNDDDADKKKPNKLSANLPTAPNNKGKKKDQDDKGKNNDDKGKSKNDDKGKSKNDNKKPSKKDDVTSSSKVQQDAAASSTSSTSSGTSVVPNSASSPSAGGRNQWKFVTALSDSSVPLDSFEEEEDDENSSFDVLKWTSTSRNPWSPSTQHAQDGKSSMVSGITSRVYDQEKNSGSAMPVYSNLTLSTESNFNGGVLTFQLLAKSLTLPRESFFVTVDGTVELPPEDVTTTTTSGSTFAANTWVEYSVPVGRGKHTITWVHVYNPFGLKVLPFVGGEDGDNVGLWMDDLRLVPFSSRSNLDPLELVNGGGVEDASSWEIAKDGSTIVATSSDIKGSVGSADIQFVLYSEKGAMLNYRVQTSTSGPHDDFAILLNNNSVVATSMFGDMISYESRSLALPKGKVVVTLSHRKNPGRLDRTLLQSLGEVGTEGRTLLESLSLNLN